MLISNWKENFKGTGVWEATNCISGNISQSPKLVGDAPDGWGHKTSFTAFGGFGEIMNMGEAFETCEEAAEFMEACFTWEVELNGRSLTLTGDRVNLNDE